MAQTAPLSPKVATVAFVGNPNAGKTTLFNGLTGSRQKVANYPGVTVEKISGSLLGSNNTIECIDVPGLYSLRAVSEDERVAADVILGRNSSIPPDLLVCVLDAANLERNLYLFSQVAEVGRPIIVALTMGDRLESGGGTIDLERLSVRLGVPVFPVIGHREQGLMSLRSAIENAIVNPPPVPTVIFGPGAGADPESPAFIAHRYEWARQVSSDVIKTGVRPRRASTTDRIDQILTHRVFGLLIFTGVMYLVFQSIYTFAQPLMDGIKSVFDALNGKIGPALNGVPILKSFICDGLVAGLSAMLQFLPQILILFFFISVLEGTGYLARAAFLMDRLLGWCGLNGRAFIPLLSSFACAIPGIMAARVMPDAKSRLATILVAPLMSCSARLPVYIMLIGAFIEPRFGPFWAGFTLFAMHLLGLLVAIPVVWLLNGKVLKGKRLPFVLELPPYQWPKWKDVWLAMYFRGRVFVSVAGTTIVTMSIVIWGLSYFPHSAKAEADLRTHYVATHASATPAQVSQYVDETSLSNSYLGRFGNTIEPVFRPAGFDWRITTAILAAFPARENVVPALGIIFSLGKDGEHTTDLRKALQTERWADGRPLLTAWSAVGLMVFFALCCQCMSTLATVWRETNSWKWPAFLFTYMTALAYIGAVGINQLGIYLNR